MNCEYARTLIVLEPDEHFLGRQARDLQDHLSRCPACRAFRERLTTAISAISTDAQLIAEEAQPSADFRRRLHSALSQEKTATPPHPAALPERSLTRSTLWHATRLLRRLRAVATAAGLVAATVLTGSLIQSAPPKHAPPRHVGHLASFNVRTSDDGRVYAALIERNSAGRAALKEACDR